MKKKNNSNFAHIPCLTPRLIPEGSSRGYLQYNIKLNIAGGIMYHIPCTWHNSYSYIIK